MRRSKKKKGDRHVNATVQQKKNETVAFRNETVEEEET